MLKDENGDKSAEALAEFEKQAISESASTMKELVEGGPDSYSLQQKLGVLQRIVTAVAKDAEYRQVLLLAAFDNKQEAMLAADAITERQRYGVTIQPILDRVIAQCAVRQGRVDVILKAMTSYSLQTNYGSRFPNWKRKQEDKSLT